MTQWKLLPVEPTEEMLAKTSWPDCARTDYAHMLAAAPQPDVQPAIYPEEARQMGLEEVAYYTHPPVADVQELERNEQYQMQMTAITTASLGYWKEGDAISPEYDTVALRDVAKLYGRYEAARADVRELVEALQDLLHQAKLSEDEGGWDFEQAQAALKKWEVK
jgi:hypothetical protein